jgi:DNA-binding transcriptional ArsR family regulator
LEITDLSRRTSDALRALSHEHRLMILCHLSAAERSVGELEKLLKLAQPAVSQQLARLRLDNLVTARRDGRTIYYRASTDRIRGILADVCFLLGYGIQPSAEWPLAALSTPVPADEAPTEETSAETLPVAGSEPEPEVTATGSA